MDLPTGTFTRTFTLPSDLLPGVMSITVTPNGGRPETKVIVLRPPPEGVVDRAEVSGLLTF